MNKKNILRNAKYLLFLVPAFFTWSCDEALDLLSDDVRDQYTGTWNVKEESTLKTTYTYTVDIEKSSSDTTVIYISNFYQIGKQTKVEGIVSGDRVTLPKQDVGGFGIEGDGVISFNGNTISWSYSVDFKNGTKDDATATYTKQ
jgi:hypothetical protein